MSVRRMILILAMFAFLLSAATFSQSAPPTGEGPPETIEEALLRHHIALTKESLVAALRNQDPEVRQLAAQKLASNGAIDTIPSMNEALSEERVPWNRANIAFALAQLGDKAGMVTLKSICEDAAMPAFTRIAAVQHLQWLHDDSCLTAVAEVLQFGEDSGSRIAAISLVSWGHHFSEGDSLRFFDLIVKALEDPAPGVRIEASSALGRLGNVSAIPSLQAALAKEHEMSIRLAIRRALQRLQKRMK